MENFKYYFIIFFITALFFAFSKIAPFSISAIAGIEVNPHQEELIITQDAINEAEPRGIEEIIFDEKIEKEVRIMEKRHFRNIADSNESPRYRIERLEMELMGRIWAYTPLETRVRRLKLASSRVALSGTSLPPSLAKQYSPKKIHNDSIQLREREQVGIIDGLLRLYAPKLYEAYSRSNDLKFERFGE